MEGGDWGEGRMSVRVGENSRGNSKRNGGREECWSEKGTGVLIEAWGERYLELSRGNLKQKHWKEVADIVSATEDYAKTDIQCKNRIDTVKKKYKLEKQKIGAGGGPSKWLFFDRLDRLIGPTAKIGSTSKLKLQFKGNVKLQGRRRGMDTESEEEEEEENFVDSDDSLPPEKKVRTVVERGVRAEKEKDTEGWGSSVRMLTQAILKFGQVYEQAESAKLQQAVEMEKARMKFAKELELQRMQFLLKTQMEISQFRHTRRGGDGGGGGGNAGPVNNISVIRLPVNLNFLALPKMQVSSRKQGSLLSPLLQKYSNSIDESTGFNVIVTLHEISHSSVDTSYTSSQVVDSQIKELKEEGSSAVAEMEVERLNLKSAKHNENFQKLITVYNEVHEVASILVGNNMGSTNRTFLLY